MNNLILTAETAACPQARTSIPATARPAFRPTGQRMGGGTRRTGTLRRHSGHLFGFGGRG